MRAVVMFCIAFLMAAEAFAQGDRSATLTVTVLDESRAVIPSAQVTVSGIEPANKSITMTAATNAQGQAKFDNVSSGRYSVTAEFSGFQTRSLPDVRIRTGENRQAVMLPIDRLQSDVTVSRDRQAAAADRDNITFGTVLTREQIDALSDDPDELRRQLQDLAGPDAKFLVDSFEGRDLPPKAMIKSIRITRDQFAPEVHYAGEFRIEILTQPGIGPVRGNVRMGFYDSATDGRNPLVGRRGPAQSLMYGVGLNGTLVSQRA
jgi:hypothetical protein